MTPSVGLSVLLFVALLVVVTLRKRRAVPGRSAVLLRSLVPSWRFFEAPEGHFILLARAIAQGGEDEPFMPVIPCPPRSLLAALYAPRGNLLLACHDLVDALVSELSERGPTSVKQAEQLASYRLVQDMALWLLRERGGALAGYQLKLVAHAPDEDDGVLFVSPVYACG